MRSAKALTIAALSVSLAACAAVGPDYRRPQIAMPASYSVPAAPGAIADRGGRGIIMVLGVRVTGVMGGMSADSTFFSLLYYNDIIIPLSTLND